MHDPLLSLSVDFYRSALLMKILYYNYSYTGQVLDGTSRDEWKRHCLLSSLTYHSQSRKSGAFYQRYRIKMLSKLYMYAYQYENSVAISQIFRMTYCVPFEWEAAKTCIFVEAVAQHFPEHSQRVMVHLLLHLVDNMLDFGCYSCFNTERYCMYVYTTLQPYAGRYIIIINCILMQVWGFQLTDEEPECLFKPKIF